MEMVCLINHLSIDIHIMEKWMFPSQLILPNLSIKVAHTFNHDETIEILCREGMTFLADYLGTAFGILPSRITPHKRHMATYQTKEPVGSPALR